MDSPYQQNYVIAISGAAGAGKTSLVNAIVQALGDAVPLYFDNYKPHAIPSSKYPADAVTWVAAGADPNLWETPQLVQDLQTLRRGKSITLSANGEILTPKRYIVLEEPFGREREAMKGLIDVVIAIDVPLEVALARLLLRTAERPDFLDHPEELSRTLLRYIRFYLRIGRELYMTVNEQVRKNCDLVVDGMKPIDEVAGEVAQWIQNQSIDHFSHS